MSLLQGEIKVGDKFIWQPRNAQARQRIEVTTVRSAAETKELWIETATPQRKKYWNEESRFREACVRVN
ncbi:MAG: hypothetical protein ACRYFS_07110 [Janthinobacterium lividum]